MDLFSDGAAVRPESIQIAHSGRIVDADVYRPASRRAPVAVFSHGFGGGKGDFAESAAFLARHGVGAVTFTFCGSGPHDSSGFPTDKMTLLTETEDLLAVTDFARREAWSDGRLLLVGGSMGGMVSALAAQGGADAAGMALLYPAFCIPDDWNARWPNDAALPQTFELWGVTLGRAFVRALRKLNVYEKMAQFSGHVCLFHGAKDGVVPLSYSERAAKAYPDAELTVYPEEGHGFSSQAMQDVNRRLLGRISSGLFFPSKK